MLICALLKGAVTVFTILLTPALFLRYFSGNQFHLYYGIPVGISLEPVLSQPFNPATMVEYQLTEAGVMELAVYYLTGSRVAQLEN